MSRWPSTSDDLIRSLRAQPLLAVLRPERPVEAAAAIEALQAVGLRHVEIAWAPVADWSAQCRDLRLRYPGVRLGAASVCNAEALEAAAAAGLGYAVSPILETALIRRASSLGLTLVPGVFSPSEVQRALKLGCALVKLFPAATLGPGYWRRLAGPLGRLPFCIAAGGLGCADVLPWLEAGVDAVALGARLRPGQDSVLDRLISRITRPEPKPSPE